MFSHIKDIKKNIYFFLSISINIWSAVTSFLLNDDFKRDIPLNNPRLWDLYLLEVVLSFIIPFVGSL